MSRARANRAYFFSLSAISHQDKLLTSEGAEIAQRTPRKHSTKEKPETNLEADVESEESGQAISCQPSGKAAPQESQFARVTLDQGSSGKIRKDFRDESSVWGEGRMDVTWVTDRIGLGGGIWNEKNMAELAGMGVTHVIDMQIEFDDTPLAVPYGIEVLWNPTDDDFQPKPPELFEKGVEFALQALDQPGSKLYIHCAAGVHRAAMMTLAVMCGTGWDLEAAMALVEGRRPVVDFADVYVESVKRYVEGQSQPSAISRQPSGEA